MEQLKTLPTVAIPEAKGEKALLNQVGGGVTKARKEDRRRGRSSKNGGLKWWRRLQLPRRGRKDTMLSPSPLTAIQESRLGEKRRQLFESIIAPRACRASALALADWDPESGIAKVVQARGATLQSMGWFENRIHNLFPEEALFLVDKGCLELRLHGLPMSIQRVWACTLSSPLALSVPVYMTYAHLQRSGFVVRRFEASTSSSADGEGNGRSERDCEEIRRHDDSEDSSDETITPDLAVWRVGSYSRRKGDKKHEPQFYVKTYALEDAPAQLKMVSQWTTSCNKSRCKIALVDRAMVLMIDVASNATPLSQRFVDRLSSEQSSAARMVADGDASGVFSEDVLSQWDRNNEPFEGLVKTSNL